MKLALRGIASLGSFVALLSYGLTASAPFSCVIA
jgi:hypothetical protein